MVSLQKVGQCKYPVFILLHAHLRSTGKKRDIDFGNLLFTERSIINHR